MPNFIRLKLLEEPETATIQELCTKARQKLILRELCPVDDWSRDGFNEMSSEHSEKLLGVLSKMSENQNALEDKMNALTEKVANAQDGQNSHQNNNQNYQNSRGRGHYRGNNRGNYRGNNRGNRGGYINNQGNGRYGNNYNQNNIGRGNWRGNNRGNYSNNNNNNFNDNNYPNHPETTMESTTDMSGHIETTQFSQVVCYSCGYPNHTAKYCVAPGRGRGNGRGSQIPFNSQPKTKNATHVSQSRQIYM